MDPSIAVIGAGVNGLACALEIKTEWPSANITIFAEKFTPNTTTDIAGSLWGPYNVGDTPLALIRKWGKPTYDYMTELALSDVAKEVGAQLVSGYIGYTYNHREENPGKGVLMMLRDLNETELKLIPGSRKGVSYTSVQLDPGLYLQWLMRRFKEKGGRVIKKRITSFDELDKFNLIINCSGIGARELCSDNEVFATRGQHYKVYAPWVKHFLVKWGPNGAENYILPSANFCVLGGTYQKNDWDTAPRKEDRERIWKGCCEILPSLKHCTNIKEEVGLRPTRKTVRLETQYRRSQGKTQTIIHNYGHGGGGVSLHWGCTKDVVELARHEIKKLQRKSNL